MINNIPTFKKKKKRNLHLKNNNTAMHAWSYIGSFHDCVAFAFTDIILKIYRQIKFKSDFYIVKKRYSKQLCPIIIKTLVIMCEPIYLMLERSVSMSHPFPKTSTRPGYMNTLSSMNCLVYSRTFLTIMERRTLRFYFFIFSPIVILINKWQPNHPNNNCSYSYFTYYFDAAHDTSQSKGIYSF